MISTFYFSRKLLSEKQPSVVKNTGKIMFVRKLLLEFWGYGHAVFCKTWANYPVLTRTINDFKILFQSDTIVRKAAFGREKYGKKHFCPETTPRVLGLRKCLFLCKTSANYKVLTRTKDDFKILFQSDAIVRKAAFGCEK